MSIYLPQNKKLNQLSLVIFTLITIIALYYEQVTVFYLIFLFWCDELLKTFFDVLAYRFQPQFIENKATFRSGLSNRFFLLFIYFVFIIVFFGFIIDLRNDDRMILNFQVVFLRNWWFNLSIINIIGREVSEFIYDGKNQIHCRNSLSPGMIVLHISIIMGAFAYFFITNVLASDFEFLGNFASLFAAIPFLLLKLGFEWWGINRST